jgi:hypothetical protein
MASSVPSYSDFGRPNTKYFHQRRSMNHVTPPNLPRQEQPTSN